MLGHRENESPFKNTMWKHSGTPYARLSAVISYNRIYYFVPERCDGWADNVLVRRKEERAKGIRYTENNEASSCGLTLNTSKFNRRRIWMEKHELLIELIKLVFNTCRLHSSHLVILNELIYSLMMPIGRKFGIH